VTLIIIVFFYIYYIQRRKAFKKLDATNHQLILANERAEESSRLKTQFIQKISHEVRTPLNLLSGFSQVLVDRNIEITDEERQDICQKISQNSDRITHLMDRMLDLSLVNSKTRIECHDRVKVVKVAEQAVNNTAIDKALHLDFTLNVDESAEDVTMITDMKSSVKALSLLLDNAQKFTQPQAFRAKNSFDGKATVELDVSVEGQRVAFVVSDTGVGVPPEEAETIFEDFVQLDEFSHGAGIGLTIARSLARHMGGDVVIDKAYTSGARFVMTLPL
jgi:signal transduction histidine kinase